MKVVCPLCGSENYSDRSSFKGGNLLKEDLNYLKFFCEDCGASYISTIETKVLETVYDEPQYEVYEGTIVEVEGLGTCVQARSKINDSIMFVFSNKGFEDLGEGKFKFIRGLYKEMVESVEHCDVDYD